MEIDVENFQIIFEENKIDFDDISFNDDETVYVEHINYEEIKEEIFDFSNVSNEFWMNIHSSNGFGNSLFFEIELEREKDKSDYVLNFVCREPNKYWEGKWGLSTFLGTLHSFIVDCDDAKIRDFNIEDDWKTIEIEFEITDSENKFSEIVNEKVEILNKYISKAERFLSGKIWLEEYETNEKLFCTDVILPLLRKMDFIDVKFTHGTREYGKDFTFSEITKFGNLRHYALQAKAGNIRGNVNSDIDEIIGQLDDAFSISYFEISANEERLINTFIVAISGYFTDNAKDKISQKVPKNLKGSIYFLDKDKVIELLEKH